MLKKIREIKNAISAGCHQSALSLALTLPSICSAIEYPTISNESDRYPKWCDNFMDFNDAKPDIAGFEAAELNGVICYALRCSFLHCGNDDILQQKIFTKNNMKITSFQLTPSTSNFGYRYGVNESEVICQINIEYLCNMICDAVEKYYNDQADKTSFTSHTCEMI